LRAREEDHLEAWVDHVMDYHQVAVPAALTSGYRPPRQRIPHGRVHISDVGTGRAHKTPQLLPVDFRRNPTIPGDPSGRNRRGPGHLHGCARREPSDFKTDGATDRLRTGRQSLP